jgi:G3E family GTPase
MTKIDIFSGFLGAGKTTLIKKLIKEAYAGEKLVLIENEFGEPNAWPFRKRASSSLC